MRTFKFESVEQAYPEIIKAILAEGKEVSPRGKLTKEISPACITITNPRKRILSCPIRKLNFGFMAAELIWILEASDDVNMIGHYNSNWKSFSDDNMTLNGAYGRRIFAWDAGIKFEKAVINGNEGEEPKEDMLPRKYVINQFQKAYEQLKTDTNSRQATIVLFDPLRDYQETKDKPCTNLLRFMIREGKLNMTTFMRSNDIWFGFPYDVYNFTMLQEIMAGLLNVEVGVYNHITDSLHMYEEHFKKGMEVIANKSKSLYTEETMDARVSSEDINPMLHKIFAIEQLTRQHIDIEIVEITNRLNIIENKYWRSIGATLALYNFRKYKRPQEELNIIKEYITSELSELTKNWNVSK